MDLAITITDEDGLITGEAFIYQDGSDAEASRIIMEFIESNFANNREE